MVSALEIAVLNNVLLDAIALDEETNTETIPYTPSLHHQKQIEVMLKNPLRWARNRVRPGWVKWSAMAACLCLIIFSFVMSIYSPFGGMVITAYACGTDKEITSTGATFTTGTINDNGDLTGHPLMFHLAGENIDTVRFSCKNGQINFIDLTEQRAEYGFAQNFTVYYGEDECDYSSLLIDWIPNNIIAELKDKNIAICDLPEDIRNDKIVMEITFANGKSVTKAITIYLEADGTFYAALDEYTILRSDNFVNRADSSPISRDVLYEQGEMTVTFLDVNGNEILPEANWYVAKNIDSIVVQWNGRAPEMVQMFFTPTGTETAKEMDFLQTEAISAENKVVISAVSLHRNSLMGHLQVIINFGSSTIKSELYNVIYDPEA